MSKTIIFSHESDIDGLGSVVLSKLAFDEIDYVLLPNVEKLEEVFRSYLENNKLDKYDKIYVTDLALYDPSLTMVYESNLKDKVLVFDHHARAIELGMNRYPFTTIIEEDENGKKCGTQLFYNYLVENNLISPTTSSDTFVELTRLEDTWQWKNAGNKGIMAHDLAILFSILGIDDYVDSIYNKLLNNKDEFTFSELEKNLIDRKKDEYEKTLEKVVSEAEYFLDDDGNKFGIVFADYEYRNEIIEYIIKKNNPENVKYFIIAAMDKGDYGQKSYRSVDDDFEVNPIAMKHGGGGHPKAAMVGITKEQKEKVLTLSKRDGLKYLAESIYS